jgi:hypothetical protein
VAESLPFHFKPKEYKVLTDFTAKNQRLVLDKFEGSFALCYPHFTLGSCSMWKARWHTLAAIAVVCLSQKSCTLKNMLRCIVSSIADFLMPRKQKYLTRHSGTLWEQPCTTILAGWCQRMVEYHWRVGLEYQEQKYCSCRSGYKVCLCDYCLDLGCLTAEGEQKCDSASAVDTMDTRHTGLLFILDIDKTMPARLAREPYLGEILLTEPQGRKVSVTMRRMIGDSSSSTTLIWNYGAMHLKSGYPVEKRYNNQVSFHSLLKESLY